MGVCAAVRGGAGWVGGVTVGLGRHRVGQGLVEAGRRGACRIVWAGRGGAERHGAGGQGGAGKWQGCWWLVGWGGMNGVRVGGVSGAG